MKTVLIQIVGLYIIGLFSAYSSENLSAEQIKKIETAWLAEFKAGKPSLEREYFVYLNIAQDFLLHGLHDQSTKYLKKAIQLEINENKTQAYIDLIMLSENKSDQSFKENLEALNKYWQENPKYTNKDLTEYLNSLMKIEKGNFTAKDFSHRFYGVTAREKVFHDSIKSKNYNKALSLMNPVHVKDAGIIAQVKYDLLMTLVKKNKHHQFLCSDAFAKYGKIYSYSMMICSILHEYQKTEKIESKNIEELESYFKEQSSRDSYLLEMVKDLRGKP